MVFEHIFLYRAEPKWKQECSIFLQIQVGHPRCRIPVAPCLGDWHVLVLHLQNARLSEHATCRFIQDEHHGPFFPMAISTTDRSIVYFCDFNSVPLVLDLSHPTTSCISSKAIGFVLAPKLDSARRIIAVGSTEGLGRWDPEQGFPALPIGDDMHFALLPLEETTTVEFRWVSHPISLFDKNEDTMIDEKRKASLLQECQWELQGKAPRRVITKIRPGASKLMLCKWDIEDYRVKDLPVHFIVNWKLAGSSAEQMKRTRSNFCWSSGDECPINEEDFNRTRSEENMAIGGSCHHDEDANYNLQNLQLFSTQDNVPIIEGDCQDETSEEDDNKYCIPSIPAKSPFKSILKNPLSPAVAKKQQKRVSCNLTVNVIDPLPLANSIENFWVETAMMDESQLPVNRFENSRASNLVMRSLGSEKSQEEDAKSEECTESESEMQLEAGDISVSADGTTCVWNKVRADEVAMMKAMMEPDSQNNPDDFDQQRIQMGQDPVRYDKDASDHLPHGRQDHSDPGNLIETTRRLSHLYRGAVIACHPENLLWHDNREIFQTGSGTSASNDDSAVQDWLNKFHSRSDRYFPAKTRLRVKQDMTFLTEKHLPPPYDLMIREMGREFDDDDMPLSVADKMLLYDCKVNELYSSLMQVIDENERSSPDGGEAAEEDADGQDGVRQRRRCPSPATEADKENEPYPDLVNRGLSLMSQFYEKFAENAATGPSLVSRIFDKIEEEEPDLANIMTRFDATNDLEQDVPCKSSSSINQVDGERGIPQEGAATENMLPKKLNHDRVGRRTKDKGEKLPKSAEDGEQARSPELEDLVKTELENTPKDAMASGSKNVQDLPEENSVTNVLETSSRRSSEDHDNFLEQKERGKEHEGHHQTTEVTPEMSHDDFPAKSPSPQLSGVGSWSTRSVTLQEYYASSQRTSEVFQELTPSNSSKEFIGMRYPVKLMEMFKKDTENKQKEKPESPENLNVNSNNNSRPMHHSTKDMLNRARKNAQDRIMGGLANSEPRYSRIAQIMLSKDTNTNNNSNVGMQNTGREILNRLGTDAGCQRNTGQPAGDAEADDADDVILLDEPNSSNRYLNVDRNNPAAMARSREWEDYEQRGFSRAFESETDDDGTDFTCEYCRRGAIDCACFEAFEEGANAHLLNQDMNIAVPDDVILFRGVNACNRYVNVAMSNSSGAEKSHSYQIKKRDTNNRQVSLNTLPETENSATEVSSEENRKDLWANEATFSDCNDAYEIFEVANEEMKLEESICSKNGSSPRENLSARSDSNCSSTYEDCLPHLGSDMEEEDFSTSYEMKQDFHASTIETGPSREKSSHSVISCEQANSGYFSEGDDDPPILDVESGADFSRSDKTEQKFYTSLVKVKSSLRSLHSCESSEDSQQSSSSVQKTQNETEMRKSCKTGRDFHAGMTKVKSTLKEPFDSVEYSSQWQSSCSSLYPGDHDAGLGVPLSNEQNLHSAVTKMKSSLKTVFDSVDDSRHSCSPNPEDGLPVLDIEDEKKALGRFNREELDFHGSITKVKSSAKKSFDPCELSDPLTYKEHQLDADDKHDLRVPHKTEQDFHSCISRVKSSQEKPLYSEYADHNQPSCAHNLSIVETERGDFSSSNSTKQNFHSSITKVKSTLRESDDDQAGTSKQNQASDWLSYNDDLSYTAVEKERSFTMSQMVEADYYTGTTNITSSLKTSSESLTAVELSDSTSSIYEDSLPTVNIRSTSGFNVPIKSDQGFHASITHVNSSQNATAKQFDTNNTILPEFIITPDIYFEKESTPDDQSRKMVDHNFEQARYVNKLARLHPAIPTFASHLHKEGVPRVIHMHSQYLQVPQTMENLDRKLRKLHVQSPTPPDIDVKFLPEIIVTPVHQDQHSVSGENLEEGKRKTIPIFDLEENKNYKFTFRSLSSSKTPTEPVDGTVMTAKSCRVPKLQTPYAYTSRNEHSNICEKYFVPDPVPKTNDISPNLVPESNSLNSCNDDVILCDELPQTAGQPVTSSYTTVSGQPVTSSYTTVSANCHVFCCDRQQVIPTESSRFTKSALRNGTFFDPTEREIELTSEPRLSGHNLTNVKEDIRDAFTSVTCKDDFERGVLSTTVAMTDPTFKIVTSLQQFSEPAIVRKKTGHPNAEKMSKEDIKESGKPTALPPERTAPKSEHAKDNSAKTKHIIIEEPYSPEPGMLLSHFSDGDFTRSNRSSVHKLTHTSSKSEYSVAEGCNSDSCVSSSSFIDANNMPGPSLSTENDDLKDGDSLTKLKAHFNEEMDGLLKGLREKGLSYVNDDLQGMLNSLKENYSSNAECKRNLLSSIKEGVTIERVLEKRRNLGRPKLLSSEVLQATEPWQPSSGILQDLATLTKTTSEASILYPTCKTERVSVESDLDCIYSSVKISSSEDLGQRKPTESKATKFITASVNYIQNVMENSSASVNFLQAVMDKSNVVLQKLGFKPKDDSKAPDSGK